MPCGCEQTCGCEIVAGPGVEVKTIGNKIIVSATAVQVGVPVFIQSAMPSYAGGPYLWIQLDNLGNVMTFNVENGL